MPFPCMALATQSTHGFSTGELQVLCIDAIGFPQAMWIEVVICWNGRRYWLLLLESVVVPRQIKAVAIF
jgi:hypothetical protein